MLFVFVVSESREGGIRVAALVWASGRFKRCGQGRVCTGRNHIPAMQDRYLDHGIGRLMKRSAKRLPSDREARAT